MTKPPIVTKQQWTEARKALLAKEKQHTRQRDELARKRRELPWVKVDNYTFDGPQGKVTLADLFRGKSQLVVYHFMFGPDWAEGCPSCSYVSDHLQPTQPHLAARDTALAMVSRGPIEKLQAFKQRLGWTVPWVSSLHNSFNHDFAVSFTPEEQASGQVYYNYTMQRFPSSEAPGLSVLYKDGGEIFHTYSTYGRGLDQLLGTYTLLDLTAKGRDEDDLPHTMSWVRYHDQYPTADSLKVMKSGSCCHGAEAKT